jgi:hypothetical protein
MTQRCGGAVALEAPGVWAPLVSPLELDEPDVEEPLPLRLWLFVFLSLAMAELSVPLPLADGAVVMPPSGAEPVPDPIVDPGVEPGVWPVIEPPPVVEPLPIEPPVADPVVEPAPAVEPPAAPLAPPPAAWARAIGGAAMVTEAAAIRSILKVMGRSSGCDQ